MDERFAAETLLIDGSTIHPSFGFASSIAFQLSATAVHSYSGEWRVFSLFFCCVCCSSAIDDFLTFELSHGSGAQPRGCDWCPVDRCCRFCVLSFSAFQPPPLRSGDRGSETRSEDLYRIIKK
jgi:hypothetical protein